MKITLILFAINLVIAVENVENKDRTVRHINYQNNAAQVPPCKRGPKPENCGCERDTETEFCKQCGKPEPCHCQSRCKEPCKRLPTAKLDFKSRAFTKVTRQKVTEKLVLTCTQKSFYDSIEFNGSFDLNLSCNALLKECHENVEGIYTGIKTLSNGKKEEHSLNAKKRCIVFSHTNGNAILNERAILNDCECAGDVLSAVSQWVADDPINGCRSCGPGDGVKESVAVTFKLKIFGKCCSECNLQYGKVWFSKGIKNH